MWLSLDDFDVPVTGRGSNLSVPGVTDVWWVTLSCTMELCRHHSPSRSWVWSGEKEGGRLGEIKANKKVEEQWRQLQAVGCAPEDSEGTEMGVRSHLGNPKASSWSSWRGPTVLHSLYG